MLKYTATFTTYGGLDPDAFHWYVSLRGPGLDGRMDIGRFATVELAKEAVIRQFKIFAQREHERREYDGEPPLDGCYLWSLEYGQLAIVQSGSAAEAIT